MSRKRAQKPKIIMGLANPDAVRRDQERRRSGAAGSHKKSKSKWENNRRKMRQELRGQRCDLCS